jgi:DNA-binding PadR family transcriptional regulator
LILGNLFLQAGIMTGQDNKYLPLTEATYYIMLALVEPLHGYAVMQKVEQISQGIVQIGPGTLYGAFDSLEKAGLIHMVKEEDRRKSYELTSKGKELLLNQIERLEIMTTNGNAVKNRLKDWVTGEKPWK